MDRQQQPEALAARLFTVAATRGWYAYLISRLFVFPPLQNKLSLSFAGIAARVMSYGYNSTTAFSKSITDIEDQATMLLSTLTSKRRLPSENDRPLIFVAHSLGGIIVKKAKFPKLLTRFSKPKQLNGVRL